MDYSVQSLRDLMEYFEKDEILSFFDGFITAKDPDISNFLKLNAIEYEENDVARTYLILEKGKKRKVIAYFTIGLNVIHFDKGVKVADAYEGVNLYQNGFHPIFKLFMIGKNDGCPLSMQKEIFEKEVMRRIYSCKEIIGTNLMYLDCIKELKEYYEKLGFEEYAYEKGPDLYIMIRAI